MFASDITPSGLAIGISGLSTPVSMFSIPFCSGLELVAFSPSGITVSSIDEAKLSSDEVEVELIESLLGLSLSSSAE